MRIVRLVVACCAALSLVATACQPTAAPVASPPTPAPLATPVGMLTADKIGVAERSVALSLWDRPEATAADLEAASAGGAKWVTEHFEWRNIEPSTKWQFHWTEADRIVDAVAVSGLKLVVRVDDQPAWASSHVTFPAVGPADDPHDFADFLEALASRYAGRIHAYEVWDQPNISTRWGDRLPDSGEYTRMLRAAYSAIKKGDPAALVVSAALAPTTRYDETSVPDLIYLRSMYGANVKGAFDVLGVSASDVQGPSCGHVEDVRGIMADRGDANKPIGIMEVSQAFQADAFACAHDRWSPWIGFITVD